MNIREVGLLAHSLMRENPCGVNIMDRGWRFKICGRLTRSLGTCNFTDKMIKISGYNLRGMSDWDINDTIRHEISHAVVGFNAGHGPVWRAAAVKMGAEPRSSSPIEKPEAIRKRYVLCFVNKDGDLEHIQHRNVAPKHIARRFITGRKEETLGKFKMLPRVRFEKLIDLQVRRARMNATN